MAPQDFDEKTFAERLKHGDESVLSDLFRAVGPKVSVALRTRFGAVLAEQDMEDVLSIALFRLWTARDTYDPQKSKLSTWLYLFARNAAVDFLRKKSKQPAQLAKVIQHTSPSREKENSSRRHGVISDLQRLYEELSPSERQIISAYIHTGGSGTWAADLSETLGLPAAHIRVARARSLSKLKRRMLALGHRFDK